jgi:aspartyl-tRNA(Asn)/glutamyl-tRNA(Gln) amidotransferase subunit A
MTSRTIAEFGRGLRSRRFSAVEAVDECLRAIAEGNPRLNAFILVMDDEARRDGREADRELAAGVDRGPLHGVPISIKDLFDVRGTATTAASRVREGHVATADAAAIARLRRAGAVIVGKTNLHEFAFGTTSDESAFGPARNPHDPSRSPGGSSGGSAASIVAGMALASLGSDTGGSIRIPAAACGVVGLKPTYGEVSLEGAVPLARSLDHAGPLTATVADARTLYRTLAGRLADTPSAPPPTGGPTLALLRRYFCDVLETGVRDRFESAVDAISRNGARIVEGRIGHAPLIAAAYMHISFGEAAAYHARTIETMPDRYTPPVRQRIELARYVLAEDYVRALNVREVLRREVDELLSGCDALILPSLPIAAPPVGASSIEVNGRTEPVRAMMLRLTQLFNMTGHPAISIPCGHTSAGLPVGLQLVGRRDDTESLLTVAVAVERALS